MKRWAVFLFIFALGCECQNPTPPPASAPPPPKPAAEAPSEVKAHVSVVDMEGRPIEGMMPIATLQPNAFDAPLARGELTGSDGRGMVVIPSDKAIFVRAWDPQLHLFANNYNEVPPGPASDTEMMTITMLPGASLRAQVFAPGSEPVAQKTVEIMLSHPKLGPWWPAKADTDDKGNVRFGSLPAGRYTIKIKSTGAGEIELRDLKLDPSGETDLGPIVLE